MSGKTKFIFGFFRFSSKTHHFIDTKKSSTTEKLCCLILNENDEFVVLVLEEILNLFVGNHLLIKDVSTSLGALHHLDNLRISATIL